MVEGRGRTAEGSVAGAGTAGATVLVVDDEVDLADAIARLLRQSGYATHTASSAAKAIAVLEAQWVDLVITDLRMPDMDGLQLLQRIRARGWSVPVVMITGHGTVPLAVQAMKAGAADFILKPPDDEELLYVVGKAVARREPAETTAAEEGDGPETVSPAMREAMRLIARAAQSDATVLLRGESGTGKELAARRLHAQSTRRAGPFVAVHCAALPEALLESELLGYEKGAFTGATTRKPGRIELAEGGTLLLDEIGDVPPSIQTKLLRLLQEKSYERLGGTRTVQADVRFVAATHRDLEAMVAKGEFRSDLFYRLAVVPIRLPSLRERPEDIPALAAHFCAMSATKHGRGSVVLAPEAIERLARLPWPGNVRELQNLVERLVVLGEGPTITSSDVERAAEAVRPIAAEGDVPEDAEPASLRDRRKEIERHSVIDALQRANGNRELAARLLGVSQRTLYYKLREHGIG